MTKYILMDDDGDWDSNFQYGSLKELNNYVYDLLSNEYNKSEINNILNKLKTANDYYKFFEERGITMKKVDLWKKFLKLDKDVQAEAIWDFVGDNDYYELWDDFSIGFYSKEVNKTNGMPYSTWVQNNDYRLKIAMILDDEVLKKEFLEYAKKKYL